MTEQIKSGDVVRFENTGNRYEIRLVSDGVWLLPLRYDGTAGYAHGIENETFQRMVRDGAITQEGEDGST